MEALHRQVLPFLLRRMKEDVLQDLPPKIIQDYYCNLSPLQVFAAPNYSNPMVISKATAALSRLTLKGLVYFTSCLSASALHFFLLLDVIILTISFY